MTDPLALRLLTLPDDLVDRAARHLCWSRNEQPGGTVNWFVGDQLHSVTFFDKSKRDVRVLLEFLGNALTKEPPHDR